MAEKLTGPEIAAMITHAGALLENDVADTVKRVTGEDATTNIATDKNDFQTKLDLAVEETLLNGLKEIPGPGLPILSEERFKRDKTVLEDIRTAPGYWIVDPVDGSDQGPGRQGTLLSLVLRDDKTGEDRVIAAWAYMFATDLNPPVMLSCVRGMGVERNGHLVNRVFNNEGKNLFGILKRALEIGDEDRQQFETNKKDMDLVPHESSIYALNEMVTGRATSFAHVGSWPWDFATVALIAEELGGTVRKFSATEKAHAFAGNAVLNEKETFVAVMPDIDYNGFTRRVFRGTSYENNCTIQ